MFESRIFECLNGAFHLIKVTIITTVPLYERGSIGVRSTLLTVTGIISRGILNPNGCTMMMEKDKKLRRK
jgi:hypothetical protein